MFSFLGHILIRAQFIMYFVEPALSAGSTKYIIINFLRGEAAPAPEKTSLLKKEEIDSMIHEAILFDMDGVIVDTHHSVTTFWQQLASEHNVHLTQEDFVQRVYGRTSEHTLMSLFPHLTDQQRQAILAEI